MNNNLISFNPCQDVFLYFDSSLKNCVDIDIKDGVDTVVFDGGNSKVNINLRNVNKQCRNPFQHRNNWKRSFL